MHRPQDLVRLHRQQTCVRDVARLLGMGPSTERQCREALVGAGLLEDSPDALSALEELKAAVVARLPRVGRCLRIQRRRSARIRA